jgi:hypothetical protein
VALEELYRDVLAGRDARAPASLPALEDPAAAAAAVAMTARIGAGGRDA